ncbi:alpha-amylase [Pasteurellaceae bacterium LIM206]|nr:alpha-amylase [Pasteurellaceae bacterium LIM206]
MKRFLIPVGLCGIVTGAYANFTQFNETQPLLWQSQTHLVKGSLPLTFQLKEQCYQPQGAVKLNQEISLTACGKNPPEMRIFREGDYLAQVDLRSGTPTLKIQFKPQEAIAANKARTCPRWDQRPLEIDVSAVFKEGETVRDAYSEHTAVVKNGKVTFMPDKNADGLLLLEKSAVSNSRVFDWHNATVYFVLTDRFYNGNPHNDNSYGRHKDGMREIGTFHGGDLAGLTQKLDYLQQLGVNVLWISSPLEQMHGWVGGGDKGDFPHYGYHGYYHLDWTQVDANMGTERELADFIQQAHRRGMRVLFDVVMNHTGYATLADMQELHFGSLYLNPEQTRRTLGEKWTNWTPGKGQNWHSFNDFINFGDKTSWANWWGKDWVRADIADYNAPGFDDLKMSLSALPDLKTESESAVLLPAFFQHKTTAARTLPDARVRDYLISWLTDWVRKYGVDGFRVDTAKHVEQQTWLQLKQSARQALRDWRKQHPEETFKDDFWMTGEAWGHGVYQSSYYRNGFDAMINFDFQDQAKKALDCFADIDDTYTEMSKKLRDFNVLSYISSHDTRLFFHSDSQQDIAKQKLAADALLLAPGAVQIYYGDESGRKFGATGSDPIQGTRSDMNWGDIAENHANQQLLKHWRNLARFRQRHIALGKGEHKTLETAGYYGFSRQYGDDRVMVIWAGK